MKVTFKFAVGSYAGTIDDIVFYPTKNKLGSFARKWVLPRATTQTVALGSAASNIASIYRGVSVAFKADLHTYRLAYNIRYNDLNDPFHTDVYEYSLFVKMMYAFKAQEGEAVDLATITLNDIQSLFSDMDSISSMVNVGLLPMVDGFETLTGQI